MPTPPVEDANPLATLPTFSRPDRYLTQDPASPADPAVASQPVSQPVSPADPAVASQPVSQPVSRNILQRLRNRSAPAEASSELTDTSTSPSPWKPGGNAEDVTAALGGLIIVLCGLVSLRAARRGRHFRAPTPEQRDEMAAPVARIMVRHLPMQLLGKDFRDATASVAATHNYIAEDRLFTPLTAEIDPMGGMPDDEDDT